MRALIILALLGGVFAQAKDFRGAQFIGFTDFERFQKRPATNAVVLISPRIEAGFPWNELIASWNLRPKPGAGVTVEAKAIYPDRETKWYNLGNWTLEPAPQPRASVKGQRDEDGKVDTDTLKLHEHAVAMRLRVTLLGTTNTSDLKFVGLTFANSKEERTPLEPNQKVWGRILTVKERSQANYPEGISEWCSPTSTSMLLSYWAAKLNRQELDYDVPEVARGVNDPNWPGTGNWPFNTAFAGAHEGIRAYVPRFSDVSELEDWIEAGVPVAVSVAYGYLKGRPERANGHLVVCIGFDEMGNIVVNDPGRSQVRQVYPRENLIKSWAESGNTVYLVYPTNWKVPNDRFGHWFSE
jgi:hypothetical protein